MRILSSPKVIESAELVARRIVDAYLEPNKTFLELREMANSGSIDLLRDFRRPAAQNSSRFALNSETG
jgi:hypothetical protein